MFAELRDWPMQWREVWWPLLKDPTVEKLVPLVKTPDATWQRGTLSILWVTLLSAAVVMLIIILPLGLLILGNAETATTTTYIWFLVGVVAFIPISAFFALISMLINGMVLHAAATQLFKGNGKFGELIYGQSLYLAPLTLAGTGLIFVPVLGWALIWIFGMYIIILQMLVLRAVYSFEWIHAIIVATVPYALNQAIIYGLYFFIVFSFLAIVAVD